MDAVERLEAEIALVKRMREFNPQYDSLDYYSQQEATMSLLAELWSMAIEGKIRYPSIQIMFSKEEPNLTQVFDGPVKWAAYNFDGIGRFRQMIKVNGPLVIGDFLYFQRLDYFRDSDMSSRIGGNTRGLSPLL